MERSTIRRCDMGSRRRQRCLATQATPLEVAGVEIPDEPSEGWSARAHARMPALVARSATATRVVLGAARAHEVVGRGEGAVAAICLALSDEQSDTVARLDRLPAVTVAERARAVAALRTAKMGFAQIASHLGLCDRAEASRLCAIASWPADQARLLETGQISTMHARVLAALGPDQRERWARKAIANGWSTRRLKTEIKKAIEGGTEQASEAHADLAAIEAQIGEALGTRAKIRWAPGAPSASVTLGYASLAELLGQFERLSRIEVPYHMGSRAVMRDLTIELSDQDFDHLIGALSART